MSGNLPVVRFFRGKQIIGSANAEPETPLVEVADLAGVKIPKHLDGRSLADDLNQKTDGGRDHLVLSQGAWSCQRSVRWKDHLYLRTWHDGYHGHWNEEMLFNISEAPHEQHNLATSVPHLASEGSSILEDWTDEQWFQHAQIMVHSPWISQDDREYWADKIKEKRK